METASLLVTNSSGRFDGAVGASAIDLVTRIPLSPRTFIDARLPLGVVNGGTLMGNPLFGVRHIYKLKKSSWFSIAAGMGLPLISRRISQLVVASYAQGMWNMHEYYPTVVPIKLDFLYEKHVDWFAFRAYADPVAFISYSDRVDSHFAIQHAVEFQFGQRFYAGLRLQGYLIPTATDKYQFAVEPFFGIEHKRLFARLGLMMPMDQMLGPPFEDFVGMRVATGLRFD